MKKKYTSLKRNMSLKMINWIPKKYYSLFKPIYVVYITTWLQKNKKQDNQQVIVPIRRVIKLNIRGLCCPRKIGYLQLSTPAADIGNSVNLMREEEVEVKFW